MVAVGIGECSFHMAKKLAFEEGFRDGACIDAHQRIATSQAEGVDFVRQHVFAGAVLTGNEHRGVCRGYLFYDTPHLGHLLAVAPKEANMFLCR